MEIQINTREKEVEIINKDRSLVQRYTRQLDSRGSALKREIDGLNAKKDRADEELDDIIQNISLDENL